VWFEAVIGYLSASKEWAQKSGDPEAWHRFWEGDGRGYYFIGKDNIPFHTIVWPAMLMGYGGLNLPYDVPANEFLTIESQKFSKSRNLAVWVEDYFQRYDADPLRYLLSANMPETSDTDFSWREFVRRNNDELVATYGNLVQRVLTFTYRNFDGKVPEHSKYGEIKDYIWDLDKDMSADYILTSDTESEDVFEDAKEYLFRTAGDLLSKCKFREALSHIMMFAQETNQYLDRKAPCKAIKTDRQLAADSLYVALYSINCLKTALYPFLPFSSQRVHEYLGFDGRVGDYGWKPQPLTPGQKLNQPQVLFTKLDDSVVEEETRRMGLAGS
jgi:methionyl-tRNA synthetase